MYHPDSATGIDLLTACYSPAHLVSSGGSIRACVRLAPEPCPITDAFYGVSDAGTGPGASLELAARTSQARRIACYPNPATQVRPYNSGQWSDQDSNLDRPMLQAGVLPRANEAGLVREL